MTKMKPQQKFEGTFWINNRLFTKNLVPGEQVYGEKIIKMKQEEFREWDSRRSKPAAAIYKNLHQFPIWKGMRILYLGAGSGTTVSHFSDIIGKDGLIYAIEISERVLRDLLPHAEKRRNITPLLMDGRLPEKYSWVEQVDLMYADIAIKDQSDVLVRNAEMFLKPQGFAMIAIKSRSINVTEQPQAVYKQQRKILENFFNVIDFVTLEPFERDHGYFVLKRK